MFQKLTFFPTKYFVLLWWPDLTLVYIQPSSAACHCQYLVEMWCEAEHMKPL